MEPDDVRAPREELIEDVDPEIPPEADGASFEPDEELTESAGLKAKLQKLKDELEKVKSERQEYLDGWQRCKADSVNAKKESAQEMRRVLTRAKEDIAEDLLPVLDSFDMAAGTPAWEAVDENWRSGMEQVRNQLLDVLSRYGIERFGKVGELFSPHLHEAVHEMDDVAGESGSVARVLRYGYKSGSRVIRPAQVIIKK